MIEYWRMGRQRHVNSHSMRRPQWKLYNATRAKASRNTESATTTPQNQATFDFITTTENLIRFFELLLVRAGAAPGPDGLTYSDLGHREVADCMRLVSRALRDGEWLPGEFREVRIPKASGGYRTLRLRNIFTRVIAAAIANALTPVIDPLFWPHSYGYRPSRSYWDLLAAIYVGIEQTGRTVLVHEDIRNAFPSLSPYRVMYQFRRHIQDKKLLKLIELVLRGEKATRANRTQVGIDQGSALSPLALNVRLDYLHDIHMPILSELLCFRYADNLMYLCQSTPEGERTRTAVSRLFRNTEFRLRQATSPIDLRTESAQLLGFLLSVHNGKPQYSAGTQAWERLQHDLHDAHQQKNPNQHARHVIAGWISVIGATLETAGEDIPLRISQVAAQYSLREIQSRREIQNLCMQSVDVWHKHLEKMRQGNGIVSEQVEGGDLLPETGLSERGIVAAPF